MREIGELGVELSLEVERAIAKSLADGDFGAVVLSKLLPSGAPHAYEGSLWDYKACLPDFSNRGGKTPDTDAAICEVVKDVVSFYNSYGGYIVFGVEEATNDPVVGVTGIIDIGRLNDKVSSFTDETIDCRYAAHSVQTKAGSKDVGLLFIPKRPIDKKPVKFRKEAKADSKGKKAFERNKTYGRFQDKCRPAMDAEDFQLLLSERASPLGSIRNRVTLLENLPPSDPNLIKFVGRRKEIESLWEWIFDGREPVKFITGFGGLGKTSLAFEFCHQLIQMPPSGLEKIVWLTGKQSTYSAFRGEYHPTTRTDFHDTDSFLRALLVELGTPETALKELSSREDLIDQAVDALSSFSSIIVVDDVDGIGDLSAQTDLVATTNAIVNQAFGRNSSPKSMLIFTSRLEIGVGPNQVLRVAGLDDDGFLDFLQSSSLHIGLTFDWSKNSKLFKKFYSASQGSPLFAAAILRLVKFGLPIDDAIDKYRDEDGEDVRQFAFERELEELTETQTKTLYAILLLGQTSFEELREILELGHRRLRDELAVLQQYHMLTSSGDPASGVKLATTSTLSAMTEIVGKKCISAAETKRRCARAQKQVGSTNREIGQIIGAAISLIRSNKSDDAVSYLESQIRSNPRNGDLFCMLGRAFISLPDPDANKADKAFQRAFEFGCSKIELFSFWMDAKHALQDWRGVIDLAKQISPNFLRGRIALVRLEAQKELAIEAARRGDGTGSESQFREALFFGNKIIREKKALGEEEAIFNELKNIAELFIQQVFERVRERPRDYLDIFYASMDIYDCYITRKDYIVAGCRALVIWWTAVEKQGKDGVALDILKRGIRSLRKILEKLDVDYTGPYDMRTEILSTLEELEARR